MFELFRKPPFTNLARGALVLCIVAISYLAFTPLQHTVSATFSDKANHFVAFFVLAGLIDFSFPGSRFSWRKGILLLCCGMLIECIQHFMPYREFSLYDVLADMVGILLYPLAMCLLPKASTSQVSS